MAESSESNGRPDPSAAGTAAEFVDALRRLKSWSGMGFRLLEKRAAQEGQVLARSTITAALRRDALPREELVVALVWACGGDQDEVDRWVTARRRIAAAPAAPSLAAPSPAPLRPARSAAGLATVAVALTAIAILIGVGVDVYATVNALRAPPGVPPTVSPGANEGNASQSFSAAADPTPVDRALALFDAAEKFARDGKPKDSHAVLLDAVRLYDELVRLSPEQYGPPLAPAVLQALRRIGVDFSVPEADLRDWLTHPNFTSYPAISQALLRSGWRLKAPVYLDVIWWNYQQSPGIAAPRHVADVRLDVLKAAILRGSNARHGTRIREFEQLLHP